MTGIASSTAVVSTRDIRDLPLRGSFSRSSGDEKTPPAGVTDGDDRRLVDGCAQRDPAALREIVRRYQPALSRFLSQLLGSPEDAEEVVIEVFLRVWQQADKFQGRASFSTWLYRIASNAAYDRLRRQARERRSAASTVFTHGEHLSADLNAETLALDRLEQEERSSRLRQALSDLRAEDRLLLVLYYTEEKNYAEIAQITHCTYPVLKMRMMRARRRLSALLAAQAPEDAE